jgi:hypothetical protein
MLALSSLIALSPSLLIGPSGVRPRWKDTTPFHLFNWQTTERKAMDVQLYTWHTERLVHTVASLSRPREILWSNAPYAGGLLASLSHRPMSSAMFYEVHPAQPQHPVAAAHLVVWFKITPLPGNPPLVDLIQRHHLQLIAEDELALVFRNPGATQLARLPQASVPWWGAFVLSCTALGLILWDFRRKPPEISFFDYTDR